MNMKHPNAFLPFYRHSLVAIAIRNGVKTEGIFKGVFIVAQSVDAGGAPLARQPGDNYTIVLKDKLDWVTSDGPRYGDVVEHPDYGKLTVQHVQPKETGWAVLVSKNTRVTR